MRVHHMSARLTSHCVSIVPPGVVSVIAYEHEFKVPYVFTAIVW